MAETAEKGIPGDEHDGSIFNDAPSEYERRLVRKLDLHIVPVVMLLYLLSFLDRCVATRNAR